MRYDRHTEKSEDLTQKFDRSAEGLAWSPDSKTIYFTAENETLSPIYAVDARGGAEPRKVVAEGFNSAVSISRDGKIMAFERTSLTMPAEVFVASGDGANAQQLTHHNDALLAKLDMNAPETFWFEGASGSRVQAMLIRPPKLWPRESIRYWCCCMAGHKRRGRTAWGYRWNEQVFSAAGYVTLMINRHGSTGYGQKFTDEITNDWGGQAYTDVMKGVDYALANNKFIDGSRMAAAGGSYGGFMADWIATHSGRFKAIISHAGVYDQTSMYATEELWFAEHDMQGTAVEQSGKLQEVVAIHVRGRVGKI